MDNLKKAAKNVDSIVKIIMYWSVLGGFVTLLLGIVMLSDISMNPEAARDYMMLSFGGIKVGIVPEYAPSVPFTNAKLFIGLLIGMIVYAGTFLATKIIRKILQPMKEGLPFDVNISRYLRQLGVLTFIGGGSLSVIKAVDSWIVYKAYHVSELFHPERVNEVEMMLKMDWKFLIVASVIFLMSYIFKYGAELQKLSDETL